MKRELTPLAALAASAGPYLPAVALGAGALALLAWLLAEGESKPSPAAITPPAPEVPKVREAPEAPPHDADYPRHPSGKFAPSVTLSDLRAVFAAGPLPKAEAVAALVKQTGCSRSAAYHVLTRRLAAFLAQDAEARMDLVEKGSRSGAEAHRDP